MGDSFLFQCKQNFIDGITPSNKLSSNKEGYKKLVSISKAYFENNRYEDFSDLFMEGQYLIALWAAHMLIEHGNPNKGVLKKSFRIIKDYSDNPLAQEVADEEKVWLKNNAEKFKEYL